MGAAFSTKGAGVIIFSWLASSATATIIAAQGTIWGMGFGVYTGLGGLGDSPDLMVRSGLVWLRCNLDGMGSKHRLRRRPLIGA